MPAAVIFDVDGTLIDSVDLHATAWQRAFARFGHRIPFERIRAQIGKGGDQLLPVFLERDEIARIGDALEAYRSRLWKRSFMPHVVAFPRVRALFARLHADGVAIALASSAKEDELAFYEQVAGIGDLVQHATSADDASRSKPNPDIFEAALARLGRVARDRDRVLVVGDTPWDVEAAARAGLRTIGMLCGGFAPEDLASAGAIDVYWDPADLLASYDASPLARPDLAVATAHLGP